MSGCRGNQRNGGKTSDDCIDQWHGILPGDFIFVGRR